MELKVYFFYCFLLISGCTCTAKFSPRNHLHRHHNADHETTTHQGVAFRPTKLFVFGDSYADTGNIRFARNWEVPYGITFPGKPAGRFSDGRVLTDYIAKSMGINTPITYTWTKIGGNKLRNGINFAFGGSGVFDTYISLIPNMTTQIDYLEKLMNDSVFTKCDLESSLALISIAGNDYGSYAIKGGKPEDLPKFISLVVDQLSVNIKRVLGLGATKVAVTTLEPLGCLPQATAMSAFQQCNETQNTFVSYHNQLLNEAVSSINNETKESSVFAYDLFASFTSLLRKQGNTTFESPLKPCCVGIGSGNSCGSVDVNGTMMYSVCNEPKSSFFWDMVHPTQAGWQAVHANLEAGFEQFLKFY